MKLSSAKTVAAYLKELPPERRKVVVVVRKVLLDHLPDGYEEAMNWGMITYQVPLSRCPNTYNKQPLCYAGLAAQKNNYSLHLMSVYGSQKLLEKLKAACTESGKKLDMGKSCIRFKHPDDLPLDVIGDIVAAVPVDKWVEIYEKSRGGRTGRSKSADTRC